MIIIMSFLMDIKVIKEKFNLLISDGEGKSIDSPIIIDYNEKSYVELEYFIISNLIKINDNFVYERSNQKLLNFNDKKFDFLKIKIIDKNNLSIKYKEFYFDITKVY